MNFAVAGASSEGLEQESEPTGRGRRHGRGRWCGRGEGWGGGSKPLEKRTDSDVGLHKAKMSGRLIQTPARYL